MVMKTHIVVFWVNTCIPVLEYNVLETDTDSIFWGDGENRFLRNVHTVL
jgi:hypothetical protein